MAKTNQFLRRAVGILVAPGDADEQVLGRPSGMDFGENSKGDVDVNFGVSSGANLGVNFEVII